MDQPPGFVEKGKEDQVCLLKKSLYGLKQSPRQWNKRFDAHMIDIGFRRSGFDKCVYLKEGKEKSLIYLLLYVDDMLLVGKHISDIKKVKSELAKAFDMKDLGEASRILGMDILRERSSGKLKLVQSNYLTKVLEKFGMINCRQLAIPLSLDSRLSRDMQPKTEEERRYMNNIPYASVIGSIMHLMICTRPDVCYAVSICSRYMANPGKEH